MSGILVIGELLAEFIAKDLAQPFTEPGVFLGPYPSGAPAIFADQAALMGCTVKLVGCVANDAFGDLILRRLRIDGVDISAVKKIDAPTTGTAFVRYFRDGEREFIFNISNSAAAHVTPEDITPELAMDCGYLHIMGSYLGSKQAISVIERAVDLVLTNGGKISFDPNIRPELLHSYESKQALHRILTKSSILLPSDSDLSYFRNGVQLDLAIRSLFDEHRSLEKIAVKHGAEGASYYDREQVIKKSAYPVTEIDPTGAGDCFGATFLACTINGSSPEFALTQACLAGAHAVTLRGPMEGNSTPHQLDRFRQEIGRGFNPEIHPAP
jgi:fructokinase